MASWLALLRHTNKAQNSNPSPSSGLSVWGLHFPPYALAYKQRMDGCREAFSYFSR